MPTLLEKAKSVKMKYGRSTNWMTDQHIELAIAWAKDEITPSQANIAMGRKVNNGNILYVFAVAFREAVRRGILVESNLKK